MALGDHLGRRQFMGRVPIPADGRPKVAFLDADWTLRVSLSGNPTSVSADDMMLLPFVARKIRDLNAEGYVVAIVSNQLWVPVKLSRQVADEGFRHLAARLGERGALVNYYDYGEGMSEEGKPDLKPSPSMAKRLEANLRAAYPGVKGINWGASLMVGDAAYARAIDGRPGEIRPDGRPGTDWSNGDRLFAEKLGIKFYEPADFFGWRQYGVHVFTKKDQVVHFLETLNRPCAALSAI